MAGQDFFNRYGLALSLALCVPLTVLLLTPRPPEAPDSLSLPHLDKLVHFALFSVASLPALLGRYDRWRWFVPVMIAFGGMIELVQPQFGRHADWGDFWANSLGVLAALGMARFWSQPRQNAKQEWPQRDS